MKNNSKLRKLIDRGGKLSEEIKTREDELDEIKATLKAEATKAKRKNHEGEDFVTTISPSSGSDCDASELHMIMKALDLSDRDFYDLVKVKTGEAKTLIGEAHYDPISTPWSKPYNVVKFRRKADLKKPLDFTQ